MKRMLDLAGTLVQREEWPKFTWNADLVAFDGPLVSLYRTDDDRDAVFVWVDCTRATNRWCIVMVDRSWLQSYLTQHCSLLDLFKQQDEVIVVNIGSKGKRTKGTWVKVRKLPKEYLPSSESILTADISSDAAKALVKELAKPYRVKINGDKDIYADDLTTIPKVIGQLYSFHYALAYADRPAVRQRLVEGMGSWKGGIDSVNLFNGLRSVIPSVHRARVSRMEMHSPGFIEFSLLRSLIGDLRGAVNHIADRDTFRAGEDMYNSIYRYMREEGISGFDGPNVSKAATLGPSQSSALASYVDDFSEILGWNARSSTFAQLHADPLSKLRALLAYYRRLRQIRPLVVSGKITFPGS